MNWFQIRMWMERTKTLLGLGLCLFATTKTEWLARKSFVALDYGAYAVHGESESLGLPRILPEKFGWFSLNADPEELAVMAWSGALDGLVRFSEAAARVTTRVEGHEQKNLDNDKQFPVTAPGVFGERRKESPAKETEQQLRKKHVWDLNAAGSEPPQR